MTPIHGHTTNGAFFSILRIDVMCAVLNAMQIWLCHAPITQATVGRGLG